MKKITPSSLLLLFFPFFSFCQVTFEKTLDFPLDQYGNDVIQTADSCYMIIGSQYDNYYQWPITDYMMFKVDQDGNLIWSKSYLNCWGDTWGRAVCQTQDNGFITCGRFQDYDACLVLIEPGGDSVWSRKYELGEGYGEAFDVCQTFDGRYAFCGTKGNYSGQASVFVCRTNLVGQQLWYKAFHHAGSDDACGTEIIQTSGENLVICGYQGDTSVLIKLSLSGDSIWMRRYEGLTSSLYSLKQTDDEGYISCGRLYDPVNGDWDFFLLKSDEGGNLAWTRSYGRDDNNEIAYDIKITGDNGYILCGQAFSPVNYKRDVLLVRTDQNGDTLWTRTFGNPVLNEEAYGVDCTSDGGFIVTGYKQVNDTLNNVYLIKTDSNGIATWIWEGPSEKTYPLHIYPNPNEGIFTIDPGLIPGGCRLQVANAAGKIIHHQEIAGRIDKMQINLQPCEPGVYFVSIKTQTGLFTGKILIVD